MTDTAERRKWRKKPVVIEAIPVRDVLEAYRDGMAAWRANLPVWFQEAFDRDLVHLWTDGVLIRTLEGQMEACREDWIIRGVKGEFYSCKPDIFAATYEPADEARAALPARAPEGLRIVFDGMPGPDGPRFVEVEDATGRSVNAGDWRPRPDGLCELVLKTPPDIVGLLRRAVALIKDAEKDTNWMADSWTTPEDDCFVAVAERALSAAPPPPEQKGEGTVQRREIGCDGVAYIATEPLASPAPASDERVAAMRLQCLDKITPVIEAALARGYLDLANDLIGVGKAILFLPLDGEG